MSFFTVIMFAGIFIFGFYFLFLGITRTVSDDMKTNIDEMENRIITNLKAALKENK